MCNRGRARFIPAENLLVGDVLYVVGGRQAVVTAKTRERAPPGQTFTTYNFEVEDFHTYFVGRAGVWVHNHAPRPCEIVLDMFENLLKKTNNNNWAAWLQTSQRLAKVKDIGLLQLKLFNEARKKFFTTLATGTPPWLNTAVQHLPAGVAGSAGRLRRNMEKAFNSTKPKGMASHHIVEKADNPLVRDVIERAGIHIDEAANGVWMPRQKMIDEYAARGESSWLDGLGPRHEGSHSNSYSQAVRDRILPLDGQPAEVIRDALQKIGKELVEGTFPWP